MRGLQGPVKTACYAESSRSCPPEFVANRQGEERAELYYLRGLWCIVKCKDMNGRAHARYLVHFFFESHFVVIPGRVFPMADVLSKECEWSFFSDPVE